MSARMSIDSFPANAPRAGPTAAMCRILEKRPGPKHWPILRRIPREETRSGTLVTPQGVGVSVADMELGEVSLG